MYFCTSFEDRHIVGYSLLLLMTLYSRLHNAYLCQKSLKRFSVFDEANVMEEVSDEPSIEKVKNGCNR